MGLRVSRREPPTKDKPVSNSPVSLSRVYPPTVAFTPTPSPPTQGVGEGPSDGGIGSRGLFGVSGEKRQKVQDSVMS